MWTTPGPKIGLYLLATAMGWTMMVGASLWWNLHSVKQSALTSAVTQARIAFEKDVLYRRWDALHGGVYAPVSPHTQPNPYLNVPERDIQTPQGKPLTKINPAYMTRQVHELGEMSSGVLCHITSLKPLRPQNRPDDWERGALAKLEAGTPEIHEVKQLNGGEYLRFIRPLITEKVCLACHASQGYKVGDIRGGISVSVPLAPIMASVGKDQMALIITHAFLWLSALGVLLMGARRLRRRITERDQALAERQQALRETLDAKKKVKQLQGLLPTCANCKRIRDEHGNWQHMEDYIHAHSEADFTHGICPECARELYPELTGLKPK